MSTDAGETVNKTRVTVIAASPLAMSSTEVSICAEGDFEHFRSSEQHGHGCI